jgi:hypothetical protein
VCQAAENEDRRRIDDAVEDMISRGTSLYEAASAHAVDLNELSEKFGQEMEKRYGKNR